MGYYTVMISKFTNKLCRQCKRLLIQTSACSFFVWVSLVSCRAVTTITPAPTYSSTNTVLLATVTQRPTEQVLPPTLTVTHTQETDPTPSPNAIPVCVSLFYEENAQVELISPQGTRVLVDVYDPGLLSTLVEKRDILLTTHTHWDHINNEFLETFPGRQLTNQSGLIEAGDVRIQGIPSAHNVGDAFLPAGGTNYIYIVEIGGLRIAHFGDIGQESFTTEQLETIGRLDVAIMQLANPYSDMSAGNQKGIKLMEQVGPKLIIPTHINLDVAKLAAAQWHGYYVDQPAVTICPSDLMDRTYILFLGEAARFAERLSLEKVDW